MEEDSKGTGLSNVIRIDDERVREHLGHIVRGTVEETLNAMLEAEADRLERIMREIRRRTRVVGAFPDGNSAINLAAARLRHIAGTRWSTKQYLNIELLRQRNAMIA